MAGVFETVLLTNEYTDKLKMGHDIFLSKSHVITILMFHSKLHSFVNSYSIVK